MDTSSDTSGSPTFATVVKIVFLRSMCLCAHLSFFFLTYVKVLILKLTLVVFAHVHTQEMTNFFEKLVGLLKVSASFLLAFIYAYNKVLFSLIITFVLVRD